VTCFEGVKVIAVNDQVPVKSHGADALGFVRHKRTKGHCQMVIIDKFFALEV
jgi:hypothetical protein